MNIFQEKKTKKQSTQGAKSLAVGWCGRQFKIGRMDRRFNSSNRRSRAGTDTSSSKRVTRKIV